MNSSINLDLFTVAYIEAALNYLSDQDGESWVYNHSIKHVTKDSIKQIMEECSSFQSDYSESLKAVYSKDYSPSDAGHDFWCIRNRDYQEHCINKLLFEQITDGKCLPSTEIVPIYTEDGVELIFCPVAPRQNLICK